MDLFKNELILDVGVVQQNQCFVLSPLDRTALLIYTNGSLFQHLAKNNTNGKDCTALLAQAPKQKGWDAYSLYLYQYYNEMVWVCAIN